MTHQVLGVRRALHASPPQVRMIIPEKGMKEARDKPRAGSEERHRRVTEVLIRRVRRVTEKVAQLLGACCDIVHTCVPAELVFT